MPDPGSLPGIKHLTTIAIRNGIITSLPMGRKGSLARSSVMARKTAFLLPIYFTRLGYTRAKNP